MELLIMTIYARNLVDFHHLGAVQNASVAVMSLSNAIEHFPDLFSLHLFVALRGTAA